MPKNLQFLVLKYIKVLEVFETFLNKGTKHKIKYIEGQNSKNKNIEDGKSP